MFFGRKLKPAAAPTGKSSSVVSYIHPELGPIDIIRSARARRISLTVRPDGSVKLTYPRNSNRETALSFLSERTDWIIKTRNKVSKRELPSIEDGFTTRTRTVKFVHSEGCYYRISKDEIIISFPESLSPDSTEVQNLAKSSLAKVWKEEAHDLIPNRVKELAAEHGFRYGKLSLRATTSRWGSCSARNDISLSIYLMSLPDRLIDYVILHELCHTVHHNHQEGFHNLLSRCTDGRHPALRRELKKYTARWK